ncbi:ABC multidrug transporter, partial [Metarhizium majus ARSEF 297]
MRGEYTQRDLLIILVAMLASAQLWGTMFILAPEFSRARLAISRVMAIVHMGSGLPDPSRKPDAEATAETKDPDPTGASGKTGATVVFDRVSFTYPGNRDASVLDNVSFTIKPKQFVGLRLYEPTAGAILMDGLDIASLPDSFRNGIALVPQDPALFNGMVLHNVSLGAVPGHEATAAECGPSASCLSGGQKQRVAIARALVRRPRLLLLDESTSALDAAGEAALQRGLQRASRDTTVLAITHRLHTVLRPDMIFVVEGGRIVDQGRHADLVETNKSYKLNAMRQMLQ